jgi:hypothetical protein
MSEERYDSASLTHNLFRAKRKWDLSWPEFGVLHALVEHDKKDPRNGGKRKEVVWCTARQGLKDLTGCNEITLRRILRILEEKGLITCLNPQAQKGGWGQVRRWRIEYERMGWKWPEDLSIKNDREMDLAIKNDRISRSKMIAESGNPERKNPPPPDPPPSPQPMTSTVAPPVLEEEEFSFLSPEERTCLQSLHLSPALGRQVQQTEPSILTAALQHVILHREDILSSGRSLEGRFGGLLRGTFVPSPEPEPLREEVPSVPWGLCQTCGVTYQGEHECSSLPERREPPGEEDVWLQRMKERAQRAQREARE